MFEPSTPAGCVRARMTPVGVAGDAEIELVVDVPTPNAILHFLARCQVGEISSLRLCLLFIVRMTPIFGKKEYFVFSGPVHFGPPKCSFGGRVLPQRNTICLQAYTPA